jgi:hypothetical protein
MLLPLQQKAVWEGWLASEIRANYFAELCHDSQRTQRLLTWSILLASSAGFATIVTQVPAILRLLVAGVTPAVSLWSLVSNYSKVATEASDLHFRWSRLAADYERLKERESEISKSATHLPNKPAQIQKWTAHVIRHRATEATA